MSIYRKLFEATEEAVFQRQVKTAKECAWYVSWRTGIPHVDENEIQKIMYRVCTQYK